MASDICLLVLIVLYLHKRGYEGYASTVTRYGNQSKVWKCMWETAILGIVLYITSLVQGGYDTLPMGLVGVELDEAIISDRLGKVLLK